MAVVSSLFKQSSLHQLLSSIPNKHAERIYNILQECSVNGKQHHIQLIIFNFYKVRFSD